MKFSKKKLLLLLILLCSIIFIFSATKESKIKDFPIPMSAINIQDDKVKAYTYLVLSQLPKPKDGSLLDKMAMK